MKTYKQFLFFIILVLAGHITSTAQTTLSTGDIAFTGYNSDNTLPTIDTFSFVILRNISASTEIKFTDNGWLSGTSALAASEGIISWTSGTALVQGTQVKIAGLSATVNGSSNGTVSNVSNAASGLSLATTGDQVLAFQGTSASPTFISGIHMNVATIAGDGFDTNSSVWDGSLIGSNRSALPPGLTTGSTALWLTAEVDNARYNCSVMFGATATVRTAINTASNWNTDDTNPYVLPAPCTMLPVKLIQFTVQPSPFNSVNIEWCTATETNNDYFEIQKSINGVDWETVTKIQGAGFSSTIKCYQYTDNLSDFNPILYYRLNQVDFDGKFEYFDTHTIRFENEDVQSITISPNPSNEKLELSGIKKSADIKLSIYNNQGTDVTAQVKTLRKNTELILIDIVELKSGLYTLICTSGNFKTSVKFVKNN